MLGAFRSALATPDLRRKILFTLGMVVLYRLGATIPSPGVSYPNVQQCYQELQGSQSVFSLLNLFSGGALLQLSVLSLGIMPYITASIIVQLLQVVIPRFEQLKKEGQSGQAKLTQYTRYLAIALAVLQATGIVALAERGQLFPNCTADVIPDSSVLNLITIVVVMTAGAALLMWMGELITERGIGNGMSLLIFTSIAARIPAEGGQILQTHGGLVFAVILVFAVAIIATVVFIEQAQRRIPVQYAKRMIGRRMYGGTSTYLPLKVNQAGVIPVIFGSSLLYLPQLLGQLAGNQDSWWARFIQTYIVDPSSWVHILLYMAMIIFFAYFYVSITFNPEERADEMKKFGGFIPGIRPGRPTAEYLSFVLSRITLPGSLYLGIIAILPNFFLGLTGQGGNQNFPFGGTAVLIMVNVGLDTVKQIESQLTQRNYEGFLR
ncbi:MULTISPECIES: preprotein translocase subunit SecY [Saccharopolyspora]|uniref:Protein translocase subunit SecY n=1 Tax=Saccharopolyspora gregorii TaxID=33914 RepID=A0ABP6S183_9PSEU|nr:MULTISPECIES: preprotein translocase subunit SecY [Saccharopolyspora]MCA1186369.1 preprotein translocase subunit SecY [Saccharopolyspora sp. 6T]MCA1191148.1 preprotein translocase subunit SecY [Saccharopolyspora sp. 6V]MCA1225722.1 preprotein translocase subunit SecY [Saccharopolyspora sp. 6M]MCA1278590.1 preprotein translocase subunit SecY [Saccharopolyspora sp. 7B]